MSSTIDSSATVPIRVGAAGRVLTWIGIRPDEQRLTALLFANIFLCGVTQCTIRVCAYTLFLSHFPSDQLAFIAIALAISGTLVTLTLNRLAARWSVRGYLYALLAVVLGGLVVIRAMLAASEALWLIFLLPLWFELAYMLFSLEFTSLLARLLDVRQTKRLAGLIRSGEFFAEMVAGVSIATMLTYIGVEDLLVVAALATLGVGVVVHLTVQSHRAKLLLTTEDVAAGDEQGGQLTRLLKQPYVRFICLCEFTYICAYFFLDVAFYDYTAAKLPVQQELAAFLGNFFAVAAATTLVVMIFLFSTILRRFGILAGILAFPLFVGAGSVAVPTLEFASAPLAVIFAIMVITNGCRFIFQSSLWRPTIAILFQVLPDRQRAHGSTLIEGIVDPLAGGAAGVCLYIVTNLMGWGADRFLILLAVLMLAWIASGFAIRRLYLSRLVFALQKRKLGELSITELDGASLNVIKRGLTSTYPAEIFYCLQLLEDLVPGEMATHLDIVLGHGLADVRRDALERIERLHLPACGPRVAELLRQETDVTVLGQALRTYGSIGMDDARHLLEPHLHDADPHIRKGTLTGLLHDDPTNERAHARLADLVRSPDRSERELAAELLGETGLNEFSGYLTELMVDSDFTIVAAAIVAAGKLREPHLVRLIVSKLPVATLHTSVNYALQRYGPPAIPHLADAFRSRSRTRHERLHIIEICRGIGGERAIETLLELLPNEIFEVRYQILVSLAHLHFQAHADDHFIYVNYLIDEVNRIASVLSAMDDLYERSDYRLVHEALGSELDLRRDAVLLLLSFIFPSIVMLDTRVNLRSKVAELRTFALEVLDNILSTEIKEIVMPLLDDLSVRERVSLLEKRFPQERKSAQERMQDLIRDHYIHACYWTRAMVIYHIGKSRMNDQLTALRNAVSDAEPIVRETALWSLGQVRAPALQGWVLSLQRDPDPAVRQLATEMRSRE